MGCIRVCRDVEGSVSLSVVDFNVKRYRVQGLGFRRLRIRSSEVGVYSGTQRMK